MSEIPKNWQARRDAVAAWLPHASREAVEAFAAHEFDRAEVATFHIVDERRRAELTALREASFEVSAAVDWVAVSRQPSHAELQRRRSVVA